jgi:acetylglutamate kinase
VIRLVGYLSIAVAIIVVHDGGIVWAKKQLNEILRKYEIQSDSENEMRNNDQEPIDDRERGDYRARIDADGRIVGIDF